MEPDAPPKPPERAAPTVVLAEKPSVARDLAAFLGARSRRDGFLEGNGFQVTWAFGHLVELKEPQDYDPALKRWSVDTLPIVPARFELRCGRGRGVREQFEVVRRLFAGAGRIVCATDAGREGELIFRYIQHLAGAAERPHERLWLSSLTEEAIRVGFRGLRPGADFDHLFDAARCRSEADWLVGINATRAYTVRGGRDVLWSVGRVQTPVLALICRRDDEIRAFVPKPFFEVLTRYRGVAFKHTGGRFDVEEGAAAVRDAVEGRPFTVTDVKARTERAQPPLLPDLTDLQREMNRRFGLSAADTLEAAQSLYEGKLITYPRTDSRHLSNDMKPEVRKVLDALGAWFPDAVGALDLDALPDGSRIYNDAKVSDHHAIIPTGRPPRGLSERDRRVFEAVCRRLIAAFHPPCVKEITTVEGKVEDVAFTARGVRVVEPGWTSVLGPDDAKGPTKKKARPGSDATSGGEDDPSGEDDDGDQELPAFAVGESGPHEPFLREGRTKPPFRFTENSLLGAMETAGKLVDDDRLKEALRERGLGTPATRASIIETLLQRGYIRREGKKLVGTDLGRYLIALIQDPLLKSPEMTGEWEAKLKAIERGELADGAFMDEIVAYTRALIDGSASAGVDRARFGSCPRCGREVIEGHRAYGCSGWREGCGFVLPKVHQGLTLHRRHAQELLQRRMIRERVRLPEAGRFAILVMTEDGVVIDLEPPSRDRQQQPGGGRTSSASAGRGEPGASEGPAKAKPAARKAAGPSGAAKTKATAKQATAPRCPLCGGGMIEQEEAYRCARWREGCGFGIRKEIAGKKITKPMAKALLTSGRTRVLKGFVSKGGKEFAARLCLEEGRIRFEIEGGGAS